MSYEKISNYSTDTRPGIPGEGDIVTLRNKTTGKKVEMRKEEWNGTDKGILGDKVESKERMIAVHDAGHKLRSIIMNPNTPHFVTFKEPLSGDNGYQHYNFPAGKSLQITPSRLYPSRYVINGVEIESKVLLDHPFFDMEKYVPEDTYSSIKTGERKAIQFTQSVPRTQIQPGSVWTVRYEPKQDLYYIGSATRGVSADWLKQNGAIPAYSDAQNSERGQQLARKEERDRKEKIGDKTDSILRVGNKIQIPNLRDIVNLPKKGFEIDTKYIVAIRTPGSAIITPLKADGSKTRNPISLNADQIQKLTIQDVV